MKKRLLGLMLFSYFCVLANIAVAARPVFDLPNTVENTLNLVEQKIHNATQFMRLKYQLLQITQMKTRLSNLKLTMGLNTWDPTIPKNYDYRGSASAEYQEYQKEGRSIYGEPWSAGDYATREGDQVMAYHYKRMDDHADHTDSKIKHIYRKNLPKADELLKEIHKKYRYLTKNCQGKTVDNDSKCSAANMEGAEIEMQLVLLKYKKEMTQMMALMVEMQMLQQRSVVEIQKQVLRPGIEKTSTRTPRTRGF